jgi:addiction module HigA family antidote
VRDGYSFKIWPGVRPAARLSRTTDTITRVPRMHALPWQTSGSTRAIKVPPRRINEICLGKRGITPDTALRLGRYFGVAAEFWMNLQQRYDLEVCRDQIALELKRGIRPYSGRAA